MREIMRKRKCYSPWRASIITLLIAGFLIGVTVITNSPDPVVGIPYDVSETPDEDYLWVSIPSADIESVTISASFDEEKTLKERIERLEIWAWGYLNE